MIFCLAPDTLTLTSQLSQNQVFETGLWRRPYLPIRDNQGGNSNIVSELEVFDCRIEEEILAANAMVTLMAVHRDKLYSK